MWVQRSFPSRRGYSRKQGEICRGCEVEEGNGYSGNWTKTSVALPVKCEGGKGFPGLKRNTDIQAFLNHVKDHAFLLRVEKNHGCVLSKQMTLFCSCI